MSSNDKTAGKPNVRYTNVGRNAACPCGSGKRFKHCHGAISNLDPHADSDQQLPEVQYCTVDGWYYRLQAGQHLFAVRKTGDKTLLLDNSLQLLVGMSRFDSLDQQINRCALKHGVNRYDASILGLKQFSQYFIQQGLLRSSSDVLAGLKKSADARKKNRASFAGISIRTCDAPDSLQQQLLSLVRRKIKWGASDPIYIFDDSKTALAQQQNHELSKRFSKQLEVYYMGLEWQHDFVNKIINALPEFEGLVESMLLPRVGVLFSAGRLTNLMTLFFAGKQFLVFDDDRLLDESRRSADSINDQIVFGQSCEWNLQGFQSVEVAENSSVIMDGDPLGRHKSVLGLSLAEFLEMNSRYLISDDSFAGLTANEVDNYQADSIILTTGNGLFGSPGKRDGRFLFFQKYSKTPAPWHKNTTGNEKDRGYEYLLDGGCCWEAVGQLSVRGFTVATAAGVDAGRLLPPTISVARAEDTLQHTMTHLLYPQSVHIEFPWALAHNRTVKHWRNDTFNKPPGFGLGELICILASEQQEL
ncbi:MAG: SEC-C domain-containing protein, partial [Proteobacteria bacterium]|nr:SEC-C domain-containing protein [Pseudomonadota bacterium]